MIRLHYAGFALATTLLGTSAMSSEHMNWPDLPTSGFVTGRLATPADVKRGDAIFSTNGAGNVVSITVPQYAYWRDDRGVKHPRIVMQAEGAPNGLTIVGLRDADGSESAATLPEVELLGTKKPS